MRWAAYFLAGLFTLVSGYFIYAAYTMDASVGDEGGTIPMLIQIQTLTLQMGLASAIIAAIFFGAAFVISALPRQG